MTRKHFMLILLYLFLAFIVVPSAYAQTTSDINMDDIVNAIGPRTGRDLLWDVMLYLLFFLALINMFILPDKQLFVTILNFVVMGATIISKLLVGTETTTDRMIEPTSLVVLVLNVGVFVVPLIMAGMLRAVRGKRPKAVIVCVIMGLLGGAYFFLFWAMEQRNYVPPTPTV